VNPATVVRTGFGRSYFQEIFGATFNKTANGYPTLISQQVQPANPFSAVFTLADGPPAVVFPTVPSSGIFPLPDGISVDYVPRDLSYSYVDSWNFSIQRLIGGDMTGTITYVGNVGHNLQQGIPLNQAIPGPGPFNPRRALFNRFGLTQGINDASNKGTNNYEGLQVKVEKRFSKGYSLLASYSFSKSIDNDTNSLLDGRRNRAVADFDRSHMFSIGHLWALPFGPGQPYFSGVSGIAKQLIAGWQFNGITQFQSGLPFSPSLNNNASLNADAPLRPDYTGAISPNEVPGGQSRDLWFNPAAYGVPALYRFGNAGRNSLRGPGLFTADWALHKAFPIREGMNLTFRWEVFNAFNRTNLANPNGAVDAGEGSAGVITSLFSPMRQMQLGLRLAF
jgi:hypothetical protein